MNEFLNPKSMITPGAAGALMMFLVNGLAAPFPELPVRYVALVLSFVIGAFIMFKAPRLKVPERVVYWVVNSLVIFVVGFGASRLGREAATPSANGDASMFSAFVPSAYAQEPTGVAASKEKAKAEPAADEKTKALEAELAELKKQNALLKKKTEEPSKKKDTSFFKRW